MSKYISNDPAYGISKSNTKNDGYVSTDPEYGLNIDQPNTEEASKPEESKPDSTTFNAVTRLADTGIALAKGVVGVPQTVIGLADIASNGKAGKAVEDAGIDLQGAQDYLSDLQSQKQKDANQKVSEADGFTGTVGAALNNPSTIINATAESLPSMALGAGAARLGLKGVGLVAEKAVDKAAPIAAGIGEGLVTAGQSAEDIRSKTDDGLLTDKQVISALSAGALTGVIGAKAGKWAQERGITDIDTLIAKGGADAVTAKAAKKGFLKSMAQSGLQEGVLEELPQSAQERMWQNWALGKPITEGVSNDSAMGMLSGGLMGMAGGGAGSATSHGNKPQAGDISQNDIQAGNEFLANQLKATPEPTQPQPQSATPDVNPAPAQPSTASPNVDDAFGRLNELELLADQRDLTPDEKTEYSNLVTHVNQLDNDTQTQASPETTPEQSKAESTDSLQPAESTIQTEPNQTELAGDNSAPEIGGSNTTSINPDAKSVLPSETARAETNSDTGIGSDSLGDSVQLNDKAKGLLTKIDQKLNKLKTSQQGKSKPVQDQIQREINQYDERRNKLLGMATGKPILQNRDRSSVASIAQMQSIAADPDYGLASGSRTLAEGTPVAIDESTIPDTQKGKTDYAIDANRKRTQVQYAVVDADQLLTSHSADGTPNAGYIHGEQGKFRVIAGNGRTAGFQSAYQRGTANQYRAELEQDLENHGIDPKQAADMKAPVLVRLMNKADVTQDIGDRTNTTGVSALDPVEQAKNDANRIDFAAFEFDDNGDPTPNSVKLFVRSMPQSEQSGLVDPNGGAITRQALDRLMSALFYKAYGSDALVRLYSQATDPEAKNVLGALADVAGDMSKLEGAGDLDIRSIVVEAAEAAVNAKRRGMNLATFAANVDIAMSSDAGVVAKMFADNIRSSKRIAEKLRVATQFALAESEKGEEDLFGAVEKAGREDVINKLRGENDNQQRRPESLAKQGRPVATGSDDERDSGSGGGEQSRGGESTQGTQASAGQQAKTSLQGQSKPNEEKGLSEAAQAAIDQFKANPQAIVNDLTAKGKIKPLYEAANVMTSSAFKALPLADKVAAYVKMVTGETIAGAKKPKGKPVETDLFVNSEEERKALESKQALSDAARAKDEKRNGGMPDGGELFQDNPVFAGQQDIVEATKAKIDQAAHEAATSPKNDLPEPTQAQKEAGNYKKGHVTLHGLDIAIENPKGSKRSGVDTNGKPWSVDMANHYGYIKRTEGNDGDQVDVFIGNNPESQKVFVVNQIDPKTKQFDEHKVMLGFDNQAQARQGYMANYTKGWNGIGSITPMTMDEFKAELETGKLDKPIKQPLSKEATETNGSAKNSESELNKDYGKSNKVFTEDAATKARELLKSKLGQLNSGLDPEMVQAGITLAGYHIEAGARDFASYTKAMIADLGDSIAPYLRSFYEGVRYYPSFDNQGMTSAADIDNGEINAPSTDSNLEPDSGNATPEIAGNETPVSDGRQDADGNAGSTNARTKSTRHGAGSNRVNPVDPAALDRKPSNQPIHSTEQPIVSSELPAGVTNRERSGNTLNRGIQAKPEPIPAVKKLVEQRNETPATAKNVKLADAENIAATLPILNGGQKADVLFAEKRLDGNKGVLFTNGTGTGKTFTALGIIKRFALQGKLNTIVVVPSVNIADQWIKAAKLFDLTMTPLENTGDHGKGIVVTTYANFGMNESLPARDWDLVVSDESHKLMQGEQGEATDALKTMRGITYHRNGFYPWFNAKYSAVVQALKAAKAEYEQAVSDKVAADVMAPIDKNYEEKQKLYNAAKKQAESEYSELKKTRDPKVVLLSATPFAYVKTVDYAEGYLFNYGSDKDGTSYNSGDNQDQFFMQHFGYRMRYNKLTRPDAKVDTGLMERQFNSMLRKTGALSFRSLDVDFDYDRKFVLTESALGSRIDEAMDWIRENDYQELAAVLKDKFDYLQRRYLLEAIKAKESVAIVKEHLALGRKVIVFHDYKKGGSVNPFIFDMRGDQQLNDQVNAFNEKFGDIIGSFTALPSPIDLFRRSFGDDVMVYNGDVPSKQRIELVKKFNDDESGKNLILVQSASAKEGVSFHDTTGKHQRVLINLGLPTQPTTAIQQEGRIYRVGQASDAIFRYLNTGTNWERWAFATTIAQRASTAENLAAGEGARALKDAFINGFQESDYYPAGHEGEGKGGKDIDKAMVSAITEFDRAKTFYFGQGKKTSRNKSAEGKDYFATPEPVGYIMAQLADARTGDSMLEPSAGHGAIARWFRDDAKKTAVEPSGELSSRLALVFDGDIKRQTFEDLSTVNKYDTIVMNPPFGSGGKLAVEHLNKASRHLNENGRMVALIPEGPAADKQFDKWFYGEQERQLKPLFNLEKLGDVYRGDTIKTSISWAASGKVVRVESSGDVLIKPDGQSHNTLIPKDRITSIDSTGKRKEIYRPAEGLHLVGNIGLPNVTFERAGTKVKTRIVVIDKLSDENAKNARQKNIDYSDITDINELFDRIENLTVQPRQVKQEEPAPSFEARQTQTKKADSAAKEAEKIAQESGVIVKKSEDATFELQGDKIITNAPAVEITTKKGKVLEGVFVQDQAMAKAVDNFTYRPNGRDGGWFVRLRHIKRPIENTVESPKGKYSNEYQQDLFGEELPSAGREDATATRPRESRHLPASGDLQDTGAETGRFATQTAIQSELEKQLAVDKITTPSEAAQAVLGLGTSAVERFYAIVTDKNGKPLAVAGSFKGTINAASVYPAVVAAEAFRVKGAANLWFVHNHPSGTTKLSDADIFITKKLQAVFDGSGIKAHGILATTPNGEFTYQNPSDGKTDAGITSQSQAKTKVPVIERIIVTNEKLGEKINSPDSAKQIIPQVANGESGLVLMDNQNAPIGFVPMAPSDTYPLKNNGKSDALYRALSMSNAAAAILYDANNGFDRQHYQNIGSFLQNVDISYLDVLTKNEFTGRIDSIASQGLSMSNPSGVFYSQSLSDRSSEDMSFAQEVLNELAQVDEFFRFPVSRSKSILGVMKDVVPGFRFIRDDTRADEKQETGAETRLLFRTPRGKFFHVYENSDSVWIDVHSFSTGDDGAAVYAVAGNYAYNTDKVFIADPAGLSDDAVIRRTSNMLSLALRFGTTDFIAPGQKQIEGVRRLGAEPLKWKGSDVDKTRALIEVFLANLDKNLPELRHGKYDFNQKQFIRKDTGLSLDWGAFESARGRGVGIAARAGTATARRGIFIKSLISSESSERPGILEQVLNRASALVKQGNLSGIFSQSNRNSLSGSTSEQIKSWLPKRAKRLLDLGKLQVVQSHDAKAEGFYNPDSDVITLVADNISSKAQLNAVLAHELVHRGIAQDEKLKTAYNKFTADLNSRLKQAKRGIGSPTEKAAAQRVFSANTPADQQVEEFAAYMVSEYTKSPDTVGGVIKKIISDFVGTIRAFLVRNGLDYGFIKSLTPADLAAMAGYGARDSGLEKQGGTGSKSSIKAMPETILINGVDRSTLNSNGQLIHQTEEGIRNFWNWFGDSKVVDAKGKPLVVYHGSPDVRGIFSSGFKKSPSRGDVFFASDSYATANTYADAKRAWDYQNAEDQVIPLYLSLKNPMVVDAKGKHWKETEKFVQEAQETGHDGIIIKNSVDDYINKTGSKPSTVYAFFKPEQAKSAVEGQLTSRFDGKPIANATGNNGEFNPDNPDIRYSIASPIETTKAKIKSLTSSESIDRMIYELQDKYIDLKRLRERIKNLNGTINDLNDAYLGEELYHGRMAKKTKDFLNDELKPLLAALRNSNITIEAFESYLHARHAPEANAEMALRNPNQQQIEEGKQKAKDEVTALQNQLSAARANGSATKDIEKSLEIARKEQAKWHGAQAFKGTEDERNSLSGMSNEEALKIIASIPAGKRIPMEQQAAKIDAINAKTLDMLEKYGLMSRVDLDAWRNAYKHYIPLHRDEAHPDSVSHPIGQGFSTKGDAAKQRVGSNAKVTHILGHIAMQRESAITRGEKNGVMKKLYLMARQNPLDDYWKTEQIPTIKTIDENGFTRSIPDPLYKTRANVLMLRVAGRDTAIVFNEHNPEAMRLVVSLKNQDLSDLGSLLGTASRVTRWLAAVNTQYNPFFGVINLMRDAKAALLNLTTTPINGLQKEVFNNSLSILGEVVKNWGRLPKTGEWANLLHEFESIGGQTGYRELYLNPEDRSKALLKEIKSLDRGKGGRAAHILADWLSDYNEAMENSVRLAAYKTARDNGMSKEQCASLAKNLTVNFNRKGRKTREFNALFMFFNSSVQSSARLYETLNGPKGKEIIAGGIALGAMNAMIGMAVMGGDGDDNEWNKIPDPVKQRGFIIPVSAEDYLVDPMALGFNVLPNIGRIAVEAFAAGGEGLGAKMGELLLVLSDTFNPLGSSGDLALMVTPSALDPFVSIMRNKDWKGVSIFKPDFSSLHPTPGFKRIKNTASPLSKSIAEAINYITGGTEYTSGGWSPTPDEFDYIIKYYTGGVGREIVNALDIGSAIVNGEEISVHKMPLVSKLYGNTRGQEVQSSRFYENLINSNALEDEIKGRIADGKSVDEYKKEHPKAVEMAALGNQADKVINKLQQRRLSAIKNGLPKEDVKLISDRIADNMKTFNVRMNQLAIEERAALALKK